MLDPKRLDELARRVLDGLPASHDLERIREDLRNNLRAVLGATLARLDLVDREAFEVQSELLARTRAKLDTLEQRIAALEGNTRQAAGAEDSKA